jgi:hypothetical protein
MAKKPAKQTGGAKPKGAASKPSGSGSQRKLPPVIGAMRSSQAAAVLADIGETETAGLIRKAIDEQGKDVRFANLHWGWKKQPEPIYKYTSHAFGYFPRADVKAATIDITDAGNIEADGALKHSQIKITLDRLRVSEYPGTGVRTVLFDFAGQHQTADTNQTQDLHFAQHYRVAQGSGAGITGYPIFVGLRVGTEGVAFKGSTVNVNNEEDQKILKFLNADVFKKGLELISTVNPAVPIVSGFATGLIEAFAHRHDNIPVQDFFMGLDFSGIPSRAQLREGVYIAVQVPDAAKWNWADWVFKRSNGQIVARANQAEPIPYNYVVIGVSRMDGAKS